jgi:hypothetical protein
MEGEGWPLGTVGEWLGPWAWLAVLAVATFGPIVAYIQHHRRKREDR